MSPVGVPPLNSVSPEPSSRSHPSAHDAAEQFEALLIGQLLHSARESDSSASADSITDFAEQHLASVMARSGGLGIARQIARGLSNGSGELP